MMIRKAGLLATAVVLFGQGDHEPGHTVLVRGSRCSQCTPLPLNPLPGDPMQAHMESNFLSVNWRSGNAFVTGQADQKRS